MAGVLSYGYFYTFEFCELFKQQYIWIWLVVILQASNILCYVQVHGDYSEDVGVKLERPADEPISEAPAETAA